jgi:hypothetical protein
MSPGNQGVFQFMKEVTFQRIMAFYNLRKWGHFGIVRVRSGVLLVAWWDRSKRF